MVGSCNGSGQSWQGAVEFVKCLNTDKYLGYYDWRLPNINELNSLFDKSQYGPALPSGNPFNSLPMPCTYQTSTTFAQADEHAQYAWDIYMEDGSVSAYYKTTTYCIWPVRAGLFPKAPSNLAAKALSPYGIVLTWKDNSSDESGFDIEERMGTCDAANTNAWTQISTVPAKTISHQVSGLNGQYHLFIQGQVL